MRKRIAGTAATRKQYAQRRYTAIEAEHRLRAVQLHAAAQRAIKQS